MKVVLFSRDEKTDGGLPTHGGKSGETAGSTAERPSLVHAERTTIGTLYFWGDVTRKKKRHFFGFFGPLSFGWRIHSGCTSPVEIGNMSENEEVALFGIGMDAELVPRKLGPFS